jgi:hypothetical protein
MGKITRRQFLVGTAGAAAGYEASRRLSGESGVPQAAAESQPAVALVKGTNSESARTLLRTAIDGLGGINRFVKPGQTVAIKPNATWDYPPGTASSTDPELLREVILLVREAGAKRIIVVDSPAGIVSYKLTQNGSATLSGKDFSDEFVGVTGSILSYVNITPPAAGSGTLYYQYDAEKKTGTAVNASTKYYSGNSPDIGDITFIPAKDFVGIVTVTYKAYNAAGTAYTGKMKFIVSESSQLISYTVSAGQKVTFNAGDFMGAFSLLSGGKTLSSVTFELPSASSGKLYYNYVSSASYDHAVAAGKKYSVDTVGNGCNVAVIHILN